MQFAWGSGMRGLKDWKSEGVAYIFLLWFDDMFVHMPKDTTPLLLFPSPFFERKFLQSRPLDMARLLFSPPPLFPVGLLQPILDLQLDVALFWYTDLNFLFSLLWDFFIHKIWRQAHNFGVANNLPDGSFHKKIRPHFWTLGQEVDIIDSFSK